MQPVCLTWEQFIPPYEEIPGVVFGGLIQERFSLRLKPVGEAKPICEGRYLLYDARFSAKEEINERTLHQKGSANLVTFGDTTVAAMTLIDLWVHPDHRRSVVPFDLAAEMWLEHVQRRRQSFLEQHFGRLGKPVPMIKATIRVGMRAYKLGIERGYIVPPEGYKIPDI